MSKFENLKAGDSINNGKQEAPKSASSATTAVRDSGSRRGTMGLIGSALRTMSRVESNGTILQLIDGFNEAVKNNNNRDLLNALFTNNELAFVPFDAEAQDTEMSAVLLCRRIEKVTAVTVIGLAVTADDLGEVFIGDERNRGDNKIVIPRKPSDIYINDDDFANKIIDTVQGLVGFTGSEIYLAGQLIVQQNADLTNIDVCAGILFRAFDVAEGLLAEQGKLDTPLFSLADYAASGDGKIYVRIGMGNSDVVDELGNYRRQDINVTMVTRTEIESGGQRKVKSKEIVTASGYVDAIIVGPDDSSRSAVWNEDNQQTLMPVFVMTAIDTKAEGVDLTHVLSGLMASNILAERNRWMAHFQPAYANHYKYRFVGSLGRELPMEGKPFRLNGDIEYVGPIRNDSTVDYQDLCHRVFYTDRGLGIAMDIEDGGVFSAVEDPILSSAFGNQASTEIIVDTLDEMFDGYATEVWANMGRPQLFVTDGTRIPLGTFVDENGEVRDARNIDLVAAEHMDLDYQTIGDFNGAIYNGDQDDQRRLSNYLRFMRTAVQTFNHTGYAYRVYATDSLFELIRDCASRSGVLLDPDNAFDIGGRRERGSRTMVSRGVYGQSGLFSRRSRRNESSSYADRFRARRR